MTREPDFSKYYTLKVFKVKPMLWSWRLSLEIILWFWLFWTCLFPFWHLQLFHYVVSCCYLLSITIHFISILLLSIGFILIFLIFFFNKRFLRDLGIPNITADHHNLWIQYAFNSNFLYDVLYFVIYLRNIWILFTFFYKFLFIIISFQIVYHQPPRRYSSIEFLHHLYQWIICVFEWQRFLFYRHHIRIMFNLWSFIHWCYFTWLFLRSFLHL